MVITKKINFKSIPIFLFLVLFPFGQIIRFGIFHPLDIVAALGATFAILGNYKKPDFFKYFKDFIFVACFSWIFSIILFRRLEVFYGFLYFLRLIAYFYFYVYIWNFRRQSKLKIQFLINSLLIVSLVSAFFGWIQYFSFPEIKPFTVWGWDDHLFRLVGTFLDPGFLGIIIVFGLILSTYLLFEERKSSYYLITIFLFVSLAFTYSRASYLAFLAAFFLLFVRLKRIKYFVFIIFSFLILILLLPTKENSILKITREFSALARIENYKETLYIIKSSPVFGVGYNNLCLARAQFSGFLNLKSHACSGADASILFVFATTGVIGFVVFVWILFKIFQLTKEFIIIGSILTALLVHSLFTNSFFYPWVLGYLMIILSLYSTNDLRRK